MLYTLILIAAVVGVFIFVKNNPKKTQKIDDSAKKLGKAIKNKVK